MIPSPKKEAWRPGRDWCEAIALSWLAFFVSFWGNAKKKGIIWCECSITCFVIIFAKEAKITPKRVGCYGLAPHVVRGYWYYTPSGLFFDNAKKKGILNAPRSASHPSKGAELTTTSRNFKGIVIQKSFWKLDFISLDCHDPAIRNERSELRFLARCS